MVLFLGFDIKNNQKACMRHEALENLQMCLGVITATKPRDYGRF
jgi:hypothetical protein